MKPHEEKAKELVKILDNLLQEPDLRDEKATNFFLSDANMLPNGDLLSFVYGAKKYHDYLQLKIDNVKQSITKM